MGLWKVEATERLIRVRLVYNTAAPPEPDVVQGETALEALRAAGVLKPGQKTSDLFPLPEGTADLVRRVAASITDGRTVFGAGEGQYALDVALGTGRAIEGGDWEDFLCCGGTLRPLTDREVVEVLWSVLMAEEMGRVLAHAIAR